MNCAMCGQRKRSVECETIELTPQEQKNIIDQGITPKSSYNYCKPCLRLLSEPMHAPEVMVGLFAKTLRESGVTSEKEIKRLSKMYGQRLRELQRKATHGTQA